MTTTIPSAPAGSGFALLEGALRHAGRHRPAARRRTSVREVVGRMTNRASTIITRSCNAVLHWSAMGCLTTAGFQVADWLGWLAAGLALIWTQHLTDGE